MVRFQSWILGECKCLFVLHTTRSHNHYDINNNGTTNTYSNTLYRRNQADSVVPGTNSSSISDFGSSTRGERHNSYYANHPQRAAHLVMFKISVGRDTKIPTTYFNGQIQLSTDPFSKSSNSHDHLFRTWRHPHTSLISCLGFVISFAHERKLHQLTIHLNS